MAALATELRRRGHRTSFLALADVRKTVEGSGAGLIPLGEATFPAGSFTRLRAHMAAPRGLGLFRIIGDMARMTDMLCSEAPAAIERGRHRRARGRPARTGRRPASPRIWGCRSYRSPTRLPIDREPALPPPFTDWRYDPSPWGLRRNAGGYRVADLMMMGLDRVDRNVGDARGGLPHRRMSDCLSAEAEITQLVPGFDFPRHAPPAALRLLRAVAGRGGALGRRAAPRRRQPSSGLRIARHAAGRAARPVHADRPGLRGARPSSRDRPRRRLDAEPGKQRCPAPRSCATSCRSERCCGTRRWR